jgi:hypothetical protein
MPVVIDEFEVIAEPPPPVLSPTEAQLSAPAQGDEQTPHDLELILERQLERMARIRAH